MGSGATKRALQNSLTALERIQRLEGLTALFNEDRQKMLGDINRVNGITEHRLVTLEKSMNAVVEIVDKVADTLNKLDLSYDTTEDGVTTRRGIKLETVMVVLKRQIQAEQAERAEQEKAAIAQAVKDGLIAFDETVSESSLIVGREVEADGTVRHPGWVQLQFSEARPDLKALFLGKKAGDSVSMGKGTFEVDEIYKAVPRAPEEAKADAGAETAPAEAPAEPTPAPAVNAEVSAEDAEKAFDDYMAEASAASDSVPN